VSGAKEDTPAASRRMPGSTTVGMSRNRYVRKIGTFGNRNARIYCRNIRLTGMIEHRDSPPKILLIKKNSIIEQNCSLEASKLPRPAGTKLLQLNVSSEPYSCPVNKAYRCVCYNIYRTLGFTQCKIDEKGRQSKVSKDSKPPVDNNSEVMLPK
jgi:hypothetical protein